MTTAVFTLVNVPVAVAERYTLYPARSDSVRAVQARLMPVCTAVAVNPVTAAGADVSIGRISIAEIFAFSTRLMKSMVITPSLTDTGYCRTIALSMPPAAAKTSKFDSTVVVSNRTSNFRRLAAVLFSSAKCRRTWYEPFMTGTWKPNARLPAVPPPVHSDWKIVLFIPAGMPVMVSPSE